MSMLTINYPPRLDSVSGSPTVMASIGAECTDYRHSPPSSNHIGASPPGNSKRAKVEKSILIPDIRQRDIAAVLAAAKAAEAADAAFTPSSEGISSETRSLPSTTRSNASSYSPESAPFTVPYSLASPLSCSPPEVAAPRSLLGVRNHGDSQYSFPAGLPLAPRRSIDSIPSRLEPPIPAPTAVFSKTPTSTMRGPTLLASPHCDGAPPPASAPSPKVDAGARDGSQSHSTLSHSTSSLAKAHATRVLYGRGGAELAPLTDPSGIAELPPMPPSSPIVSGPTTSCLLGSMQFCDCSKTRLPRNNASSASLAASAIAIHANTNALSSPVPSNRCTTCNRPMPNASYSHLDAMLSPTIGDQRKEGFSGVQFAVDRSPLTISPTSSADARVGPVIQASTRRGAATVSAPQSTSERRKRASVASSPLSSHPRTPLTPSVWSGPTMPANMGFATGPAYAADLVLTPSAAVALEEKLLSSKSARPVIHPKESASGYKSRRVNAREAQKRTFGRAPGVKGKVKNVEKRDLADLCSVHRPHDTMLWTLGVPEFLAGYPSLIDSWRKVQLVVSNHVDKAIFTPGSTGGVYFLVSKNEIPLAVFKPRDEEPGAENCNAEESLSAGRAGVEPGYGYLREIAAFLLDRGFAGVPVSALLRLPSDFNGLVGGKDSSNVHLKMGAVSAFVPGTTSLDPDIVPPSACAKIIATDVHRMALLDIRLLNCDRHGGNILIYPENDGEDEEKDKNSMLHPSDKKLSAPTRNEIVQAKVLRAVPIDHGLCLPTRVDDIAEFEWLFWPQADLPLEQAEVEFVENLNIAEDVDMLDRLGFPHATMDLVYAAGLVLKAGVKKGCTIRQIGMFVCRRSNATMQESGLERLIAASRVSRNVMERHASYASFGPEFADMNASYTKPGVSSYLRISNIRRSQSHMNVSDISERSSAAPCCPSPTDNWSSIISPAPTPLEGVPYSTYQCGDHDTRPIKWEIFEELLAQETFVSPSQIGQT